MSFATRVLLATLCLAGFAAPLRAQNSAPQITVVTSGSDGIKADISFLMGLTSEKHQAQLPIVLDYLRVFELGIDPERPIRFDVIVENTAIRQRPSFPIANSNDFMDNLDGFGITTKKKQSDGWALDGAFEGYLREYRRMKIMSISEDRNDVPRTFDPTAGIEELLADGHDMVADLKNEPAGIDARRKSFERVREELVAAIGPMEGEAKEDFELRKLLTEQQINELERFFVEAEHINGGWTTDQETKTARGQLKLQAIADTDLQNSFKLLGVEPSYFSGVARSDDPWIGLLINHPLDEFRQNQAVAAFEALKSRGSAKIDENEELDDAQKTAGKSINDALFDMLTAGAKAGLFDIFIDLQQAESGELMLIGGWRTPASDKMVNILNQLTAAKAAEKVEVDVEKIGEASLHKVTVNEDDKVFGQDFGEDRLVYVVTSPEAVWYAAGPDSLDRLKAALAAEQSTEEVDRFFHLKLRAKPWVELRSRLASQDEESSDKDDGKIRGFALEAFEPGDDRISAELRRVDDEVAGKMSVETGLLRLIGMLIADFSEENLDE